MPNIAFIATVIAFFVVGGLLLTRVDVKADGSGCAERWTSECCTQPITSWFSAMRALALPASGGVSGR